MNLCKELLRNLMITIGLVQEHPKLNSAQVVFLGLGKFDEFSSAQNLPYENSCTLPKGHQKSGIKKNEIYQRKWILAENSVSYTSSVEGELRTEHLCVYSYFCPLFAM